MEEQPTQAGYKMAVDPAQVGGALRSNNAPFHTSPELEAHLLRQSD